MYIVKSIDGQNIVETDKLNESVRVTIDFLLDNGINIDTIKSYKNAILLTETELIDKVNNSSIDSKRKNEALNKIQNKQKISGISHGDLRYIYLKNDLWVRDGLGIQDITKKFFNPMSEDSLIEFLDTNKKVDLSEITREDILKAIEKYDELKDANQLNKKRENKKYILFINSKEYPPKYIVSIAYGLKYNEETLSSEYLYATGNQVYAAQWCLKNVGFELFEGEKFKSYLREKYSNINTQNTYYNDLRKVIKILQRIKSFENKNILEIFELVQEIELTFEEYDKAQKSLGYDDKQLYETYKTKIKEYLLCINNSEIEKNKNTKGEKSKMLETNINQPLNQILYGPPGTGKTYNVINKTLEVLLEKEPNLELKELLDKAKHEKLNKEDRKKLTKAFKKYKIDGQIEFVTFHQSYGYEEFVEGIKAIPKGEIGNESGNEMIYKVIPGVFKQLCETAFESTSLSKINNSILDDMSESPNIWKISLGWLGSIKDECFKDSVIRIGWDDYGDLNKGIDINQRELKDFYSSMNIGDIVLAFKNQWEIDGIGVVVGEYEFDDSQSEFKHKRKVKWIQINKTIDIKEFNKGKRLTLSTLYRLSRISKTNVLNMLVEKNDQVDKEIPSKNYVLVIDEINRGNISKIFGELITLVESSKRLGKEEEIKVSLPYSNQEFGVPSNVYIIGTMNTADRSIALMDTALRRRFDFKEMMPEPMLLNGIADIDGINIQKLLEVINQRVEYLYDRDHTIGHAYFMSLKDMTENEAKSELDNIFRNKIIPLLQEYFYDDWEKIQIVLGDHYAQLKFGKSSTQEDAKSFSDSVNSNRFIQSQKIKEIEILGFNHDDIEDDSIDYRVNPKKFETKAYMKIYNREIVKENDIENVLEEEL